MNTGQSKRGSLVESLANIVAGVAIAFTSQLVIFGYYGMHVPIALNAKMTAWFTAVSLVRSFVLRRVFNKITTQDEALRGENGVAYTGKRCYPGILHAQDLSGNCLICEPLKGCLPARVAWNNVTRDGRCQ